MTVQQETVSVGSSPSKERKVAFEKFVLEVQKMPNLLQIDVQMRPLISSADTETPPSSPGISRCMSKLICSQSCSA
jgi:hypothetical protein